MLNLKALALLTISVATLSFWSPAKASSLPVENVKDCEYIRRNINTRLPKGVNLSRSVFTEVTIEGKTTSECVVYGNETAIRYALIDYRTLPDSGVELPKGIDALYYGYTGSYVLVDGESAIIIFTDSASARE